MSNELIIVLALIVLVGAWIASEPDEVPHDRRFLE